MGIVFDIQRFCIHDGPGIRTTVFFKGCPLCCAWCHNPESWSRDVQLSFSRQACTFCGSCPLICPCNVHEVSGDEHSVSFARCASCGACVSACPAQALRMIGYESSPEEIMSTVLRDAAYYTSGGGVTLSGGEPLYRPDFAIALLQKAKENGLHTCIETSGFCSGDVLERCLPLTDLFLFDFKLSDDALHKKYTGVSNIPILKNLKLLDDKGASVVLRCPVIPEINDCEGHFKAIAKWSQLTCIRQIEIMPYHKLGEGKSSQIGREYTIDPEPVGPDAVDKWKADIRRLGCVKDIV